MTPAQVADRYFQCVLARDLEGLVALYAEDADVVLPDGRTFAGVEAIRRMYEGIFARTAPVPTPGPKVVGEKVAAVEIQARVSDGAIRRTANFFHLNNAGLLQRLRVYEQAA